MQIFIMIVVFFVSFNNNAHAFDCKTDKDNVLATAVCNDQELSRKNTKIEKDIKKFNDAVKKCMTKSCISKVYDEKIASLNENLSFTNETEQEMKGLLADREGLRQLVSMKKIVPVRGDIKDKIHSDGVLFFRIHLIILNMQKEGLLNLMHAVLMIVIKAQLSVESFY